MQQIFIAFITGLTTGGLSCLAVQGGLLAGSLANQIEQDLVNAPVVPMRKGKKSAQSVPATNTALPILLFLAAKLVAYTLLGALLGLLGSFLTFDPFTRAVLLFAIGIFMVGNALRMLNVHPVFRYFAVEPPKFITRAIRRTAKGTDPVTPLFLGALTVFIPCGVTQAMMAAAIGTGNMAMGAALMAAFILGTSPVFFAVAYFAAQLGKRLEGLFMRFVAVVVLVLGLLTIESGLNLIGSPVSFAALTRGLHTQAQPAPAVQFVPATQPAPADAGSPAQPALPAIESPAQTAATLVLNVQNNGYSPDRLNAPADTPISLNLVTQNTRSCARDFVIPALKVYQLLPQTGSVPVEIPPQPAGSVMRFTCSMGMYTGEILFQ